MGKRKKSSRGPAKKIVQRLDTAFNCLFCNHERSVSVTMDKKNNIGSLHCKICGQSFQTRINGLSQPVDVYSDWFDAVEEVNEGKHSESEDENSDSDYESDSDTEPSSNRRKAVGIDSDEEEEEEQEEDEDADYGRKGATERKDSEPESDSDDDGKISNKRGRAAWMDSDDE
ncbi:Elf1p [Kluyveromyces lactis]|uniref:Transcription elongation factor 1 homolog n=1 Tax=Kluyveromyces lactis (strain ATCC 8585 / CBS 2359 / DSM 70799 / NBRC 1267 / NRRL Y-1140 / WM37) TaxID=284590 RepID=Q6CJ33_KLULA|nr:uncharacterized protein KLLA0_F21868g [Kluyveromyces lactis]CAG98764.1 KLLA0F21868p [Kluyveromyces lactis]|eukprot:XP_456056.1 uncharacterized protein KLLA0_F21868g [Kluyveromyces lactis]